MAGFYSPSDLELGGSCGVQNIFNCNFCTPISNMGKRFQPSRKCYSLKKSRIIRESPVYTDSDSMDLCIRPPEVQVDETEKDTSRPKDECLVIHGQQLSIAARCLPDDAAHRDGSKNSSTDDSISIDPIPALLLVRIAFYLFVGG